MTVNHKLKLTLSWLAVLLFMLAIYFLSSQPASVSNAYSKGIVAFLVENALKLTGAAINDRDMLELSRRINSTAREYMHGVVFLCWVCWFTML
ncbi:MAG TPA: VanZ family protein [Bacillota bacterium]|nr:VanZ family protein [Bacillota bacterium]